MPVMSSTSLCHVAQIILQIWSCYQSLVTLTFFIRKVIITSMLWGFEQKNQFLMGGFGSCWIMRKTIDFILLRFTKGISNAWKAPKYAVFSDLYFPVFSPNTKTPYLVGYFSSSVLFGQISKLCTSSLNLSQSLSTFNFSKFSTFSKF